MNIKTQISRLSLLLCSSLLASSALATITVSESGSNLVISTNVSGEFGDAPTVAVHDDFDKGATNTPLSAADGWALGSSQAGFSPIYSTADSVTGTQSAKMNFTGTNYNSTAEFKNLPNMKSAYVSYHFKIVLLSGLASRNLKLARISGGHSGSGYIQATGLTLFPMYKNGVHATASIDTGTSKVPAAWTPDFSDGDWHRAEYFVKLSEPFGTATGTSILRVDGKTLSSNKNSVTDETGIAFKWLTLPYYSAHDQGGDYIVYTDNVVVSDSQSHVEFCDQASYTLCKHSIVPKLASWTGSSISVDKTEFLNSANKKHYIYIIDKDGTPINSKGIWYCPLCPKMKKN